MNRPPEGRDPSSPLSVVTSVYVWGSNRAEVNRTARRVAARLDPNYAWVQAEVASDEMASPPRALSIPGPELVPRPAVAEQRLWTYLKAKGQQHVGRDLLDFVRLPEPLQVEVAGLLDRAAPRVLAFGNVDLVPASPGSERCVNGRLIEFLNSHEITLVVSAVGKPLPERIDFDYSIATPEVLPRAARGVSAVCQWGDCHDCIVQRILPPEEVVCVAQLVSWRSTEPSADVRRGGFASH